MEKSRQGTKKRTQHSFSASGSRDWVCFCSESQRLVLTLCWTRRLAAEPLAVLDERKAGTDIAMCFFSSFFQKNNTLFPFPPSVYSLCCHALFLFYSNIKDFLLFVIPLLRSTVLHCVTSVATFLFPEPPSPYFSNTPLIHFIAVCSCRLGNFSAKQPQG